MLIFQLFAVLGAAGLLSCMASLIALHILPTGFHPISDPVSNYAVSRYGFLYRLQAFSSGICGVCLLVRLTGTGIVLPFWRIVALGFYSLTRRLIIFFRTDVKPSQTLKGTIHGILAAFTFTGIAFVAGILTPPLISLATWSKIGPELHADTLLTDVAAVIPGCNYRPSVSANRCFDRTVYLCRNFTLVGYCICATAIALIMSRLHTHLLTGNAIRWTVCVSGLRLERRIYEL